MSFRFSKRIKIAPGIRLNLSARGASVSAGPRGASVTLGKRGTAVNFGIPGTGLSFRQQISSPRSTRSSAGAEPAVAAVSLTLHGDGRLEIADGDGSPLSESQLRRAKQVGTPRIREFLEENCRERNSLLDRVAHVHCNTSGINSFSDCPHVEFTLPRPSSPQLKSHWWGSSLFVSWGRAIDEHNARCMLAYDTRRREWSVALRAHNQAQAKVTALYDRAKLGDEESMVALFEQRISEFDWPLPTEISFQFSSGGTSIWLDVDLPEIEEIPMEIATVKAGTAGLNLKPLSESERRELYMAHTHGVLFRVVGEAFASLPHVKSVIVSGYSQRPDKATGRNRDEYLISAKVERGDWSTIDFQQLQHIDPATAFERHELIRNMTKTGIFRPIEPIRYAP